MPKHHAGMGTGKQRKQRGRTAITSSGAVGRSSKPGIDRTLKVETNRPVEAGVLHRGDRRDMSKTYTNNQKHATRGDNPRPDVKTRKR